MELQYEELKYILKSREYNSITLSGDSKEVRRLYEECLKKIEAKNSDIIELDSKEALIIACFEQLQLQLAVQKEENRRLLATNQDISVKAVKKSDVDEDKPMKALCDNVDEE